jgi:hypothetical protein
LAVEVLVGRRPDGAEGSVDSLAAVGSAFDDCVVIAVVIVVVVVVVAVPIAGPELHPV